MLDAASGGHVPFADLDSKPGAGGRVGFHSASKGWNAAGLRALLVAGMSAMRPSCRRRRQALFYPLARRRQSALRQLGVARAKRKTSTPSSAGGCGGITLRHTVRESCRASLHPLAELGDRIASDALTVCASPDMGNRGEKLTTWGPV
ncbi:MAG: hypothetical protein J2P17_32555 [Mycobacterium sp.]|nr:hypothetical protein [Mycobacterium sp.]